MIYVKLVKLRTGAVGDFRESLSLTVEILINIAKRQRFFSLSSRVSRSILVMINNGVLPAWLLVVLFDFGQYNSYIYIYTHYIIYLGSVLLPVTSCNGQ